MAARSHRDAALEHERCTNIPGRNAVTAGDARETRRGFFLRGAHALTGASMVLLGARSTGAQAEQGRPAASEPTLEHSLTVHANIEPAIAMGRTPAGERRVIPISGGVFEGVGVKGVVMPGGEDWQLVRSDGVTELDARYWLRADDGALIRVHNRALSAPAPSGGARYVRCAPRFEAPVGPHDWLNKAIFVGTLAVDNPARPKVVTLRFFKVA
jgi:Protein of unknown function (DUF3237)